MQVITVKSDITPLETFLRPEDSKFQKPEIQCFTVFLYN